LKNKHAAGKLFDVWHNQRWIFLHPSATNNEKSVCGVISFCYCFGG
jgi:hypothetical protein